MTNAATEQIAQWVAEQAELPLPTEVADHVRRIVVDELGAMICGSQTETVAIVGDYARTQHTPGSSTAVGFGDMSSSGAALVNGTAAHALEVDDGYTPGSVHPSAVTVPAVFAVAQSANTPIARVPAAVAIGVELVCRIAEAGHPATWRNHFHNTPLAGALGAAAAAVALAGSSPTTTAHALGIAASHAGGLFEFLGQDAEVKRLHPGKAARDGVASAALAQAGLTGPTTVLEGEHGYFAAFAGDEGLARGLTDGLGTDWRMLSTYFKPYPACRHLHGPIDAVLQLREEAGLGANDVAEVRVGTYEVACRHNERRPTSVLGAQMSIPFAVATTLVAGRPSLSEFGAAALADPQIAALANRVSVSVDTQAQQAYPTARPATVQVIRTDGSAVSRTIQQPYGEPTNPLSYTDLVDKFHGLVDGIVGSQNARRLVEQAWAMDDLGFVRLAGRMAQQARECRSS